MTPFETIFFACLAFIGLCLSAFFSGTETGIYTLNRVRLTVLSGQRDRRALLLRDEIRHPNRLLATLLIGNNLANYLGSLGITALLEGAGFSGWGTIALNALVLTPVLFIFGETLPKDLFRTNTDRWTYAIAPLLVAMRWLFTATLLLPIVRFVGVMAGRVLGADATNPPAARQRISQLIREGVGAGVLSEPQMALAERALSMRNHRVAREMIPWQRVHTIPLHAGDAERRSILSRTNFTRLPVVDRAGAVVGVLNSLDAVLDPQRAIPELMYERFDLPADLPVVAALGRMRKARRKFAVAVDPGTKEVRGIVTLKDLVEPLTGELAAW